MSNELRIAETVFFQDLCADGKHRYHRRWFDGKRRCVCGAVHPDDLEDCHDD